MFVIFAHRRAQFAAVEPPLGDFPAQFPVLNLDCNQRRRYNSKVLPRIRLGITCMAHSAGSRAVPDIAEASHREDAASLMEHLAHELRQPLGAIESIAYYLNLVLPREDTRAREQLAKIQVLVEQSNWILNNGIELTRVPEAACETIDIEEMLSQESAHSGAGREPVLLRFQPDLPLVRFETGRLRAILQNLFAFFRILGQNRHALAIETVSGSEEVVLRFHCAVPGYRSRSGDEGTGDAGLPAGALLSLAAARRVADAHQTRFVFEVDPLSGVSAELCLPAGVAR